MYTDFIYWCRFQSWVGSIEPLPYKAIELQTWSILVNETDIFQHCQIRGHGWQSAQEQGTARNDETMARSALLFVQAIKWGKLRRRYSILELQLQDRLREARGVCGPYPPSCKPVTDRPRGWDNSRPLLLVRAVGSVLLQSQGFNAGLGFDPQTTSALQWRSWSSAIWGAACWNKALWRVLL